MVKQMSVNKAILLGNLGHSPQLAYTADSGVAVVRLSLATTKKFTLANGDVREDTEWHRVVAYGRLAEVINEYVQKGNRLWIEGHLRTRKYVGKDGIEKSVTEIIADKCEFFRNKTNEADQ